MSDRHILFLLSCMNIAVVKPHYRLAMIAGTWRQIERLFRANLTFFCSHEFFADLCAPFSVYSGTLTIHGGTIATRDSLPYMQSSREKGHPMSTGKMAVRVLMGTGLAAFVVAVPVVAAEKAATSDAVGPAIVTVPALTAEPEIAAPIQAVMETFGDK